MTAVISLVLFTMPGLLTYMWINLFGVTPTIRKENSEVVAISLILWIPVVIIVISFHKIIAFISNVEALHPVFDMPILKKNWSQIESLSDIVERSDNLFFFFYFFIASIIVSYIIARILATKGYDFLLKKVNEVRTKKNIAPLTKHSTVWNTMFLNNDGQVVEYSKIDGASNIVVGGLIHVPRAHEADKAVVFEAPDHWGEVIKNYNIQIDNVYIDTNSGAVLKVYNLEQAKNAEELYNNKFYNDITSSE